MNGSPDSPSSKPGFRLRTWHFAFLCAAGGIGYFCWWASLEQGVTITNLLRMEVVVTLPFLSLGPEVSREQEEDYVLNAGGELRAILEARLQKEGLARMEIAGSHPYSFLYRTSFEGSPEIQAEFWTHRHTDERGLNFFIECEYKCALPRAPAKAHEAMSQLVKEFERHLEFWLEESRQEFLSKRKEFE